MSLAESFLPEVPAAAMFNATSYSGLRRPFAEAEMLPGWCYTSEVFYQREVERIFLKAWNFIGRADRIPNVGDYFTLEFVGIPIIVARGKDGAVRAFANTCRHRGSLIMTDEGNCLSFRCPYHSWAYGLDGNLVAAPEMDETPDFDRKDYGLIPIRLEMWSGFMFINFDRAAGGLAEWLGGLPELLRSYDLDQMICVRRREYDLACNWKLYVENAMEAYHVHTVHRMTLQRQKGDEPKVVPPDGEYMALYKQHEGSRALLSTDQGKGFPRIEGLAGNAAKGSYYPLAFPSTMFGCTIDCVWWLELHPQGPLRTKLIVGSCFPRKTAERSDFQTVVENYYKRWDISIPEDNVASELQQRGLMTPFYRPGRFSHLEPLVHTFGNWVIDRVIGDHA
jgi:phenylpropionate dioxygenase-like ring-hydroxylating dioxygenase large terminal subunit